MNVDDLRVTAYAQGELSAAEAAEVECLLRDAPEAQAELDSFDEFAGLLSAGLKEEWQLGMELPRGRQVAASKADKEAPANVVSFPSRAGSWNFVAGMAAAMAIGVVTWFAAKSSYTSGADSARVVASVVPQESGADLAGMPTETIAISDGLNPVDAELASLDEQLSQFQASADSYLPASSNRLVPSASSAAPQFGFVQTSGGVEATGFQVAGERGLVELTSFGMDRHLPRSQRLLSELVLLERELEGLAATPQATSDERELQLWRAMARTRTLQRELRALTGGAH